VQPELIAGLEIGDLGDGQGAAVAGDVDVDFWPGEVEARGIGAEGGDEQKEGS
jgi:hypothetical protein